VFLFSHSLVPISSHPSAPPFHLAARLPFCPHARRNPTTHAAPFSPGHTCRSATGPVRPPAGLCERKVKKKGKKAIKKKGEQKKKGKAEKTVFCCAFSIFATFLASVLSVSLVSSSVCTCVSTIIQLCVYCLIVLILALSAAYSELHIFLRRAVFVSPGNRSSNLS
jgi:hypothetical protein